MTLHSTDSSTRTNSLEAKLHELCQAILDDAEVSQARADVEAFLEDDGARELYAAVMQKSEQLHNKQRSGVELTDDDIVEYNKLRDSAFSDSRVQKFQAARGFIQEVEDKVVAYTEKTLELGRIPTPDEVVRQGGCCGGSSSSGGGCSSGGCGC